MKQGTNAGDAKWSAWLDWLYAGAVLAGTILLTARAAFGASPVAETAPTVPVESAAASADARAAGATALDVVHGEANLT